ncbi:hypothetical protein TSUD_281390 [Trifolium subterraneum]|uniref:Uncharacterized protein n=1 Tax=Trifolium subterraneum TaxID=3900 RepID=A0A2Z6PW30_TRISU|nr:hypothetical protein TSUD_281390 [Trifolium subterraneum]
MMVDILKSEIPSINSSFDHYNNFLDDSTNHTNCLYLLEKREVVVVANIDKLQSQMLVLDGQIEVIEGQLDSHLK